MNQKQHALLFTVVSLLLLWGCSPSSGKKEDSAKSGEIRLITLDPGHFHAALVQKQSYPQISDTVYVYAPAGAELQDHLNKIEQYNDRSDLPTRWNEVVYTGNDFLEKMLSEKKGNVMVTAGNNLKKTEYIFKTLEAGINVLADKPMVILPENFEMLKSCFEVAAQKQLLLYDIMTERYEITTILQRELSCVPDIFGQLEKGSPDNPAVTKESVHHFFKTVSGNPLKRPAWFFDTDQQGGGIVDVNTHLVDLVQWECFPEQIIDYTKDIKLLSAKRWTTPVSHAQFTQATKLPDYPEFLHKDCRNDTLYVYANGEIIYQLKGVCAKVSVTWNYEAPSGAGDTHFSIMRGTKADLVIRQGAEQGYKPALYIEPMVSVGMEVYEQLLAKSISALTKKYPGIGIKKVAEAVWEVQIPESYRNGHEAHFGQVAEKYLQYLKDGKLPDWEVPNMLAKYYTTTEALKLAKSTR